MKNLMTFTSWADVVRHVSRGYPVWYQAPFDRYPVQVTVELRPDGMLWVVPPGSPFMNESADPFTADEGHLSRFRQEVTVTKVER